MTEATKEDHSMTEEKLVVETKRYGDQYPPSRPGRLTYLIGAAVIAGGVIIVNWAAISSFLHLPQIRTSLGL